jgi:hypothetical protein
VVVGVRRRLERDDEGGSTKSNRTGLTLSRMRPRRPFRLLLVGLLPLMLMTMFTTTNVSATFNSTTTNPSNSFSANTLAAPTGLTATQSCSGSTINASLAWTATSSTWADGYVWQRTLGGAADGSAVTVSGQATTSSTDTSSLSASTAYGYELRATRNSWLSSAATTTLTTTTCVAPPQVASVSSTLTSNTTSLVLAKPANVAVGDLLVAYVDTHSGFSMTPPAGWTSIRSDWNGDNWSQGYLWWKIAAAGDTGSGSYTFSISGPHEDMLGSILRITGANASTPINASAANGQGGGTVTSSITAPGVTTTVVSTLMITFCSTLGAANSYTPPGSMTEHVDASASLGSEDVASEVISAAGATGTRTFTITNLGSVHGLAQTIAVRP